MCIIIFAGIYPIPLYETGLDLDAEIVGDVDDKNFFQKNYGKGQRFPGGPSCLYKGVRVPCMCWWSKKGSITLKILVDIFAALDGLKVFEVDRDAGILSFLLVDGYGSRV